MSEQMKSDRPVRVQPDGSAVLADKIARDIFEEGSVPSPCQRIQFLGGQYPDAEIKQGGFCEEALARCIAESLRRHLPNAQVSGGRAAEQQHETAAAPARPLH